MSVSLFQNGEFGVQNVNTSVRFRVDNFDVSLSFGGNFPEVRVFFDDESAGRDRDVTHWFNGGDRSSSFHGTTENLHTLFDQVSELLEREQSVDEEFEEGESRFQFLARVVV